jgi:serine/threonine protein kinase
MSDDLLPGADGLDDGEGDSLVGSLFAGRFHVEALLGSGGMGSVYRARHEVLQRLFALKVIRKDLLQDLTIAKRFRREAQAASRIDHPNIIGIIDFGQAEDGRLYLAMEYIEGPTLAEVLVADGPFPVPRVLWILAQIADALDAAQASNVIHRDLKPINILVTDSRVMPDQIKILDFGLAKIVDVQATAVTVHGKIFGTPEYISPERCMDQAADHRADIYSLGIIIFELLVGQPPFFGKVIKTLGAHINEPAPAPSKASRRKDIPPGLDQLVLRCLAKRPEDRFQTGTELGVAVQLLRRELGADPAVTLQVDRSAVPQQPTIPLDDLVVGEGVGLQSSDTITFDSPKLLAYRDAVADLQPLEELAYALRERGIGTPQITHELALLIEAKDLLLHSSAAIHTLQEHDVEAQMTARIRESHLNQIYNQLGQEIIQIGDTSPAVTNRLHQRSDAIASRIRTIGEEEQRVRDALQNQLGQHKGALPRLRETLDRRAESLRAVLRRLGPLTDQATDEEIRLLVDSARI